MDNDAALTFSYYCMTAGNGVEEQSGMNSLSVKSLSLYPVCRGCERSKEKPA